MDGEIRTGPGHDPEGQGSYGTHTEGDRCSPGLPLGALSCCFIMGCLVAGASGYSWLGILITGVGAVFFGAIFAAVRSAHASYCRRKTWWLERDQ